MKKKKYSFSLNLSIAFVLSLAFVFIFLEWSTTDIRNKKELPIDNSENNYIVEYTPVPIYEKKQKQEAAKIPKHINILKFEIVDNYLNLPEDPIDYSEPVILDEPLIFDNKEDIDNVDIPFVIVENMPTFPGGDEALMKFLSNNIRYPHQAIEYNISGRVYVKFIIEKDGSITNIEIVKSVDKLLNDESIRVIKLMPKWKPGIQGNKNVRVSMILPINFVIN